MGSEIVIKYAENFTVVDKPVRRNFYGYSHGQSASGYGKKISTDRMVKFAGSNRLYRVYCVCYSNNGSCYVVKGGETLYFKSTDFS